MIKISDAVDDLVAGNAFLRFGLYHRLLNLSQVARFMRPMIEGATRKPVRISAISMALSRLQREINDRPSEPVPFRISRINLNTGLCILTFPNVDVTRANLQAVYAHLSQRRAYMTVCEGTIEMTMICDARHLDRVIELMETRPIDRHENVSGLGVRFDPTYIETPGLIYELLQQLAIQRINLVEIASTRSELNIYLRDVDVRLAFDSLYARFIDGSEAPALHG